MICNLCPRQCGADRSTALGLKRSICHASDDIEVALVSLHAWEEPILEAKKGAGTIFFSHCNLRCCFCQNYEILNISTTALEKDIPAYRSILITHLTRFARCST